MPGELERLIDALLKRPNNATGSSNVVSASGFETINVLTETDLSNLGTVDEVLCLGLTCDLLEHIAASPSGETLSSDGLLLLGAGVNPL